VATYELWNRLRRGSDSRRNVSRRSRGLWADKLRNPTRDLAVSGRQGAHRLEDEGADGLQRVLVRSEHVAADLQQHRVLGRRLALRDITLLLHHFGMER